MPSHMVIITFAFRLCSTPWPLVPVPAPTAVHYCSLPLTPVGTSYYCTGIMQVAASSDGELWQMNVKTGKQFVPLWGVIARLDVHLLWGVIARLDVHLLWGVIARLDVHLLWGVIARLDVHLLWGVIAMELQLLWGVIAMELQLLWGVIACDWCD